MSALERAIAEAPAADLPGLCAELERLRASAWLRLMAPADGPRPGPDEPDRAVRIEEAADLLGMSRDYLYRHWVKLGGYRDDDGLVKFALSVVQAHVRRRAPRPGQREAR